MYPKLFKKVFGALSIAACLSMAIPCSAISGQTEDVSRFLEMLESGQSKVRTDAAKRICRSSLTDPALFDAIEAKLLTGYTHDHMNSKHMDEMAWYCKALAVSGDFGYEDTLKKVVRTTTSEKLKRHCRNSIDQIPVHARQNQTIKSAAGQDNALSPEENKMIAMLQSNDPVMMRDAAKRTSRNTFSGEAVTDVMAEELLKACTKTSGNRNLTDALAWMCKALGSSGKDKYKATLNQVIEISSSEKLKKYARKSLNML